MQLINRIKGILLQPKTEWQTIADEPVTSAELYKTYVAPLAAIGPVASFFGLSLVGIGIPLVGQYRMPFTAALSSSLIAFIMSLVGMFLIALVINALAPAFNGSKNWMRAFKLAVYASTPAWLAGIFQLLPALTILAAIASAYAIYLLYLGLPTMMKSPEDKSVAYTAVVVLIAIAIYVVIGAFGAGVGSRVYAPRSSSGLEFSSPGAATDQLDKLSETVDAAAKKMEAAQQSGDVNAQMAAAGEMLGALAGGTSQYDPVDHTQLATMIPAELNGWKHTQLESSTSGMAGINIANAQAGFGDGGVQDINLSITDIGGGRGIGIAAAWAAGEQSRETEHGYEKTIRVGDRIVHEEYDKNAQQGSYSVLVGKRFVVEAQGYGVEMDLLRRAVNKVDLGRLDTLKEHGAKK